MAKPEQAGTASRPLHSTATKDGLTVKVYRGDGSALLAFNLDEDRTEKLAGFSVRRTAPGEKPAYLPNRFHFNSCVAIGTLTRPA